MYSLLDICREHSLTCDSKGRQLLYFNTQEVKTFKFAGIVENDVRCALATLQDWVRQQPHLPDCSGE
ncbi:unnamed protein product [Timema podura]|uniref:Uncharacterized protein n=1 Tax=Timema podura TaxID=61482 RepID=A0ABN7PFT9_TIMPD|nr:unnamed protein product [Timema podura]